MQASGVSIGVGSRRRSASQAIDLPSDGGGNLGRLFTPGNLLPQIRVVPCLPPPFPSSLRPRSAGSLQAGVFDRRLFQKLVPPGALVVPPPQCPPLPEY